MVYSHSLIAVFKQIPHLALMKGRKRNQTDSSSFLVGMTTIKYVQRGEKRGGKAAPFFSPYF